MPVRASASRPHFAFALALVAAAVAIMAIFGDDPSAPLWRTALASGIALGVFACAGGLLTGPSLREALGLAPGRLRTWQIVVLALGLLGASGVVDTALRQAPVYEQSSLPKLARRIAEGGREPAPFAGLIVGAGVASAAGEELFFRGWMLRVLIPAYGSAVALVLSSIAFGVVHADVLHGLGAAVLGLYLGAAALAAGNVRVPLVCHLLNNVASFAMQAGWLSVPASIGPVSWQLGNLAATAAGVAVIAWALLRRQAAARA